MEAEQTLWGHPGGHRCRRNQSVAFPAVASRARQRKLREQAKQHRREELRRAEQETWASKSGPLKVRFVDPETLRK
jgi:hypothetical protein